MSDKLTRYVSFIRITHIDTQTNFCSIAIVNSDKVYAPLPLHTNFTMLTRACSLP